MIIVFTGSSVLSVFLVFFDNLIPSAMIAVAMKMMIIHGYSPLINYYIMIIHMHSKNGYINYTCMYLLGTCMSRRFILAVTICTSWVHVHDIVYCTCNCRIQSTINNGMLLALEARLLFIMIVHADSIV